MASNLDSLLTIESEYNVVVSTVREYAMNEIEMQLEVSNLNSKMLEPQEHVELIRDETNNILSDTRDKEDEESEAIESFANSLLSSVTRFESELVKTTDGDIEDVESTIESLQANFSLIESDYTQLESESENTEYQLKVSDLKESISNLGASISGLSSSKEMLESTLELKDFSKSMTIVVLENFAGMMYCNPRSYTGHNYIPPCRDSAMKLSEAVTNDETDLEDLISEFESNCEKALNWFDENWGQDKPK